MKKRLKKAAGAKINMEPKTKKIITTTGYYGTGSSAITDLLRDNEEITSMGDFEFKFLHEINGVSDLEFRFVENHHRTNSGHALKLYLKYIKSVYGFKFKKGYRYYFGKRWLEESKKYIEKLATIKFKGYCQEDLLALWKWNYYFKGFLNTIAKRTGIINREATLNLLPREMTYLGLVSKEEFCSITNDYIESLLNDERFSHTKYVFLDQAVPCSNVARYTKYFNDIKVFVVDRDPRDIYLLAKFVWKSRMIPIKNVEDFCVWYDTTRKHRESEKYESNVMFLYFEDLICNYSETKGQIEKFLELENINPNKTHFDPDKSKKNTRLWENHPEEHENIKIIEKKLVKYLYKGYSKAK